MENKAVNALSVTENNKDIMSNVLDKEVGNSLYGNDRVNLAKPAQSQAVIDAVNDVYGNAINGNDGKAWHEVNCEYCKQAFKKKTTWQRFCCTEHQALAYELRTGKKWYGKNKWKVKG